MPALFVGQAWTFGIIAVTYGRLNILTAFVFAMLVGMGIDFAVHVYGRSLEKFNEGHSWEEAIFDAIWKTGRALISAWLTTVVALAMLIFAHFEGFREFGVVCTLGITVCLGTTFLIIPPLIGATERVSRAKRRPPAPDSALPSARSRWLLRLSSAVFLLLALWGAYASREVGFEYNLRKLESSKPTQGIKYGAALGSGKSSTPGVILGNSEAQMREVHKELRSRLRAGDPRLTSFLTVETFLPSDMDARLGVIDEIHDILNKKALKRLEGREGEAIAALLELTQVEPFTAADLPEWIRRSLTEKDGSFGHIGLLYGKYRDADSKDVAEFQKRYGSIPTSTGDVKVSTSGFILSDVVRYVQADGKKLLWLVMLSLVVILLLDFRDLFATVVCLACLVAGILITLGIMWAYDLKVGLFNMVVLPTALGIGIDGATHIYHRFKEEGPDRIWFILKTTGNSVIAAALTTVAGFIGLAFVDHAGIRSLGQLAVISITVCMAAAIGILPGLLTFSKYKPKSGESGPKGAEAEPKA
jgi:predicted RND superfamily exporter protein